MGKLFFIGDSITVGAWDDKGGWANRLIAKVMQEKMKGKNFYCIPYNLGVSGDTAEDVLKRLRKEISVRLDPEEDDEKIQFVFAIGINDSVYLLDEEKNRFTEDAFRGNLIQLCDTSKDIAQKISFIGMTPVDESLLNPIPWAPDKSCMNKYIRRYEDILKQVCLEHHVPFLPVFDEWISRPDYKELLFDGVHPNTKGHALLADKISSFLFDDDFYAFHTG